MLRPHGAYRAATGKGMGCPLLHAQQPAPHGLRAYPFPPARLGAAPASRCGPKRPLLAGLGGARVGTKVPPSFQTAAFGGGWARASRSTHQAPPPGRSRLLRCPCGAAWPRGLAARSVAASVLGCKRPPYEGGPFAALGPLRQSPARCAGACRCGRSAPPALAGQYAPSRAGPGASAGYGSSLSALLAAPCPPRAAACASATPRAASCLAQAPSQLSIGALARGG